MLFRSVCKKVRREKKMKNKGLNGTQLKVIALVAMVCDHMAWRYLVFFTPLAQTMHIIGRLTIPIMCFFIAEGYRHTHNIKRYLLRMSLFAGITVVPFYLFFSETYGYRQNFIFDLLLGLFMLMVLESKTLRLKVKWVLGTLIFLTSVIVGGWPVLPIVYILIFYYKKSFKEKVIWFTGVTIQIGRAHV